MKINGILKKKVEIEVEPKDLIKALFSYYFNVKNKNDIVEKDGKLYFEKDVSTHGSPKYEYVEITSDHNKIEIYNTLKKLSELI